MVVTESPWPRIRSAPSAAPAPGLTPSIRSTGQVVAGNANWSTQYFGTTNDYLIARDWPLASGRLFEPNEMRQRSESGRISG